MLGISLLIFVILLMILFVVASLYVSKLQKIKTNAEMDFDDLRESIIHQFDKKEKPPN